MIGEYICIYRVNEQLRLPSHYYGFMVNEHGTQHIYLIELSGKLLCSSKKMAQKILGWARGAALGQVLKIIKHLCKLYIIPDIYILFKITYSFGILELILIEMKMDVELKMWIKNVFSMSSSKPASPPPSKLNNNAQFS